jgi:hypothetical protein
MKSMAMSVNDDYTSFLLINPYLRLLIWKPVVFMYQFIKSGSEHYPLLSLKILVSQSSLMVMFRSNILVDATCLS